MNSAAEIGNLLKQVQEQSKHASACFLSQSVNSIHRKADEFHSPGV
jgi:hypothetical protein